VEQAQPTDLPITATLKVPESLWRSVKIDAIQRRCTLTAYVRAALEARLAAGQERQPAKEKR
jgi:hypothetical protein